MPTHSLNDTYLGSTNIYLNSKDAVLDFSDSHKTFYLNNPINPPPNVNILIGLTQFVCPATIYNINNTNNQISFETATGSADLTLPTGNYDADTVITELNQALADAEGDLGGAIVVLFDDINTIFKFSSGIAFSITSTTMEKELGLTGQTPTTFSSQYRCEKVCNLAGTSGMYVNIKNLGINNLDSRGDLAGTIAKVDIDVNFGSYIFYSPPEHLYFMINDKSITNLEIQLTDDDGDEIELNGSEFNLVFTIHYSYRREPVLDTKYSLEGRRQNVENDKQGK